MATTKKNGHHGDVQHSYVLEICYKIVIIIKYKKHVKIIRKDLIKGLSILMMCKLSKPCMSKQ